jgi:citrate synthase
MDNMVVDWTRISFVDGQKGRLYYRGIDIAELAAQATFEETMYLLICGLLPTQRQLDAMCWKLRHLALPPDRVLRIIKELPRQASPLQALQVALSALVCIEQGERLSPEESLFENTLRVIAQTPVLVAAMHRHSLGLPLISPLSTLNHAENFHYMLTGQIPSKMTARFFETALILQMDHGFNPSTFTARAVASTLAGVPAAAAAAVSALSGPLHGGATTSVLEMIDGFRDATTPQEIRERIQSRLSLGQRIMGMGHRVYRTFDPRARILDDLLLQLTGQAQIKADYDLLKSIEIAALDEFRSRDRKLFTNIDFWTGTLYHHLGLGRPLYPAIFASARIVGWCSHVLELRQENRLYRPLSQYRGDIGVAYTPIAERSRLQP